MSSNYPFSYIPDFFSAKIPYNIWLGIVNECRFPAICYPHYFRGLIDTDMKELGHDDVQATVYIILDNLVESINLKKNIKRMQSENRIY